LEPQLALRSEVPDGVPCIGVFNKTDLARAAGSGGKTVHDVHLSAKTGQGLDRLVRLIRKVVGAGAAGEGAFSARARHIEALRRTRARLEQGRRQLAHENAPETLAEELRLAQKALGEITGEYLPDDLLGAIFSSFCIGK